MKARDRISTKAKEHVDKLNQSAIARVKHSKLSEKYQRDVENQLKYKLDKVKEKQRTYKGRRD